MHVHFLENDSLGVRSSSEWIGLPSGTEVRFLVILVVPLLVATVCSLFTSRSETARLSCRVYIKLLNNFLYMLCLVELFILQTGCHTENIVCKSCNCQIRPDTFNNNHRAKHVALYGTLLDLDWIYI